MPKPLIIFVFALIASIGVASFFFVAPQPKPVRPLPLPNIAIVANDAETEVFVHDFCGACHVIPRPDLLPRRSWQEEIAKAFRRYRDSGRKDLMVPDRGVITEYFSRLASDELVFPPQPDNIPSPVVFQPQAIELPDNRTNEAVSFLHPLKLQPAENRAGSDLLLCDIGSGGLHRLSWREGQFSRSKIGQVTNPSHIIECDFDHDGKQDFLVGDLGTFAPSDDMNGSVALLRSLGEGSSFDVIPVQGGLGRVADAELADLDGDGDDDFVVAEFGFEKAGRLLWLETLAINDGRSEIKMHVIDPRHGSIHAPVTDLDGDGDLDLIVLFSQEHECIVAFMNDGHGIFEKRTLFQADSPSFGSSGMELVDLDQDGDLDVLFTNGDTLDTFQIKPFHAVNWLENQGNCQFDYHQLTTLPGATRAVAGDFDNDGDIDIAAIAYYPNELHYQKRPKSLDTVIWLEQTSPRQFARHLIESSSTGHMALAVGDFDGDQDDDLAVGDFPPVESKGRNWLTIYWNQRNADREDRRTTFKTAN